MTEIWDDDAPGERRAALVEDGRIVEIHIQRDLHRVLGECGNGRVDRKTPSGVYIMADDGAELLVRGKVGAAEGAGVAFEVTREAIAEPGRFKPAEARLLDVMPGIPTDKDLLWHSRLAAMNANTWLTKPVGDALDAAMVGASRIGDVMVSFQRTKAGLVFDVDGIGYPLAINRVAATEIARLLRLYQVGGMVMIDFVSVESKAGRIEVAEAFDEASASDARPFERSAINGYGLMQVVRARPRSSVLDQLFGTNIAALSDETQALWLLREAARSSGFGPRVITASTKVAALLSSAKWQAFREQCQRLSAAPVDIIADEHLKGYGHVHVAQS
ncbi:MAG: ribonuclease E/G [Sphingomonadaceae bacterium]|nr:ribonuclease E/G [Sphingomonadaceae bacterium]